VSVKVAAKQELVIEKEFVRVAVVEVIEANDVVVSWTVWKKTVSHWTLLHTSIYCILRTFI